MGGAVEKWRITIVLQKGKACDPASGKLGEVTVARGSQCLLISKRMWRKLEQHLSSATA